MINRSFFGKTHFNMDTYLYEIKNQQGISALITDYGATIVSLYVPDQQGHLTDVVLGYSNVAGYEEHSYYLGATIGRNCNRIKNGVLKIDDIKYQLDQNDGFHNLHTGNHGFDRQIWDVKQQDSNRIIMHLTSPDKSQELPGNLEVYAEFILTDANELHIKYTAVSDMDTICNITNHTYYNLNGHNTGSIKQHELQIDAEQYTPVDTDGIPLGTMELVEQTVFDYRAPKLILQQINENEEQLFYTGGYDHNYILHSDNGIRNAASVKGLISGITMELSTDSIGMQFYSGNFLEKHVGKDSAEYNKRSGFCLEPQFVPNAINDSKFTSPYLKAKDTYVRNIVLKFDSH